LAFGAFFFVGVPSAEMLAHGTMRVRQAVDYHSRALCVRWIAAARRKCRKLAGTLKAISRLSLATPGQVRPPAEFKHINKRRKRNLQGFP
jgi:hypothetical protein